MKSLILCLTLSLMMIGSAGLQAQPMSGKASYYNAGLHGNKTSSGERYDHTALTAASLDFPIGTLLRVTNTKNGKSVEVRINDCGPHRDDRIIDLSGAAAVALEMIEDGVVDVSLTLLKEGRGRMPCGRRYARSRVQTYDASGNNPTPAATPEREAPPISRQGTYQAAALETINSGFGVQVASYREYANAERHLQELQTKGFSKVLIRLQGNVHQVVLGPFETREAAQVYKDNLRSNYQIRGFVTALE